MNSHIDKVRAYPDNGESIGAYAELSRTEVVASIKNGTTFPILKNAAGNWRKGQPVDIIKASGTEYIKTVDNGKSADNLERLPES